MWTMHSVKGQRSRCEHVKLRDHIGSPIPNGYVNGVACVAAFDYVDDIVKQIWSSQVMVQYSAAGVSVRLAASSSDVADIERQIMGPRYFEVVKDEDEVVSATYACAAPGDVDTTCADDGEGRFETTTHPLQ
jgi:hypothetical protein